MTIASFKKLYTYWYSVIIYDYTVIFCKRYIKSQKLKDQMEGAARSGKQNIVEGSTDLRTSLKIGIKLTNVAQGSLDELIEDYEDFLRQRSLKIWPKGDYRVKMIRAKASSLVGYLSTLGDLGDPTTIIEQRLPLPYNPEEEANLLLTLSHIASFLLYRQVTALEKKHEQEGGYSEKLYEKRKSYLQKNK